MKISMTVYFVPFICLDIFYYTSRHWTNLSFFMHFLPSLAWAERNIEHVLTIHQMSKNMLKSTLKLLFSHILLLFLYVFWFAFFAR